jgi:phage terminase large subunit
MPEVRSYTPLPKGRTFHQACYDPKYDSVLYRGAFGAGKSLALTQQAADMALNYPGTRHMVVRKRFTDLRDTTLVTFQESVDPRLYTYNKQEHTATFAGGAKLLFRGLDKLSKLGSVEVATVLADELYELSYDEFKMLKGRARQKGTAPEIAGKVIGASNPCDIGQSLNGPEWMYVYFEKQPKDAPGKFPGRFQVAANSFDNPFLPQDYVANLMRDYPPSWVRRFLYGDWGTVPKGDPVFTGFTRDMHGGPWHVDPALRPVEGLPMYRGWDFGWHHPAVVWFQRDPDGRVLVHDVLMGSNEYLVQFAPRVLAHSRSELFNKMFYAEFEAGDHAGHQVKDSAEKTSIQILESAPYNLKFSTRPAHVSESLETMQRLMNTVIKSAPGIVFHPRCEVLVAGAEGGYCRIRPTDGNQMSVTPYKDGFFEHPWDAFRYGLDMITRDGALTPFGRADTFKVGEPGWSYNDPQEAAA